MQKIFVQIKSNLTIWFPGRIPTPGKCCRVSKCCRNCSILLTVVLVVVGIIFIVAYSVSTVPTEEEIEKKFWDIWGGIQHHLHITEEGNTTMSDNVTQVATTAGMGHRSLTRHWSLLGHHRGHVQSFGQFDYIFNSEVESPKVSFWLWGQNWDKTSFSSIQG